MRLRHPFIIGIAVVGGAMACAAAPASAQAQRGNRPPISTQAPAPAPETPPGTGDPSALSAAQIQRWFDAFTVLQAQDALSLSEGQYGRFVTRFKALQDVRRKHQQQRARMLAELRKMTDPDAAVADDARITERLKALQAHDDLAARALRSAYDGVDETLDLRQQARFRIFEERMEQQKLEMLMRARQNARAAARRGRGGE